MLTNDYPWTQARATAKGTGITRTGDRTFTAKFAGDTQNPQAGTSLGARYTADLDPQGRFVKVEFVARGDSRGPYISYTDFGSPVKITTPPGAVLEGIFPTLLQLDLY
jgi:hypothetical protein